MTGAASTNADTAQMPSGDPAHAQASVTPPLDPAPSPGQPALLWLIGIGSAAGVLLVFRPRQPLSSATAWTKLERAAWIRGYRHNAGRTTGEMAALFHRLAPSAAPAIDALAGLREEALYGPEAGSSKRVGGKELSALVTSARRGILLGR